MITGPTWSQKLRNEIGQAVIGQDAVIERLLVALLANGHVLLEGMPGLAKTLLIRSLGTAMGVQFERIQFTPDLLPSDVVGTMIFSPKDGGFATHKGPIFANLVLADEINRAPAKVQSALLEAMQERQVTIGGHSHILPKPFFVMATQNPVEQEGTYPLPEAQTDRFLFKLLVDYPTASEESLMMERWGQVTKQPALQAVSSGRNCSAPHAGRRHPRLARGAGLHPRARPQLPRTRRAGRGRRQQAPTSISAPRPAPRSPSSRPVAPSPGSAAATTSHPLSSRKSSTTPSATASASPTRPRPRVLTADKILDQVLVRTPVPAKV
jgi:MoxR-like ATPase